MNSLEMHMVNAVKMCIPIHWWTSKSLSVKEWFTMLGRVWEIEELLHVSQECFNKFNDLRACWHHIRDSEMYQSLLDGIAPCWTLPFTFSFVLCMRYFFP